ncbi:DUF2786 domain-containing protein [Pseudomonas oryzihabitans]|uniref:DUF2786 domain-containing protein n=1 Tax=Pseudomonas oryzihabitans TaxID=47885 RepID=UPI002894B732|nr:DUF2786 domain-containing protein [Pseudomonas oryzihabitans]MDT3722973.1 DUF2786 domain-containing protein [Pseudomonas oryzihabitans]
MEANKQKILERVAKCFALAKDAGAAANEAETALRQARKLMQQHNLLDIDVQAVLASEALVATGTRKAPADWLHKLALACAQAFDCDPIACRERHMGWAFKFIGIGVGPEMARYAYSALHQQLIAARKDYVRSLTRCKLATKRRRGQLFADSWVDAVSIKVQEFAQAKPEETQQVIDAYVRTYHPDVKTSELRCLEAKGHDIRAVYRGFELGAQAQLNRGVGQQRDRLMLGGRP